MFRKVLYLCLALIMVLSLVLAGCAKSTPAPTTPTPAPTTPTPAPTTPTTPTTPAPAPTTPAPAPAVKPIVLKLAPSTLPPPPAYGQTMVVQANAELIKQRTNGRVIVEPYWGQTLAKATELTSAVQTGLADLGWIRPYGEPGKLPLSTVGEMPGISADLWSLLWAFWEISNMEPLKSEIAKYNMRPILTFFTQEIQLITKVPLRTVADFKGKKVASGGIAGELLKNLGMVPLAMAPPEQYEGLLRGTIDAISAPIDAMDTFKFQDAGKYLTITNLGPRLQYCAINNDSWNKISPQDQKAITDLVPEFINAAYTKVMVDSNGPIMKNFAAAGVEVINLSASDMAQIQVLRDSYGEKWVADQAAKGLDGRRVLDAYRSIAAKYESRSPYYKK